MREALEQEVDYLKNLVHRLVNHVDLEEMGHHMTQRFEVTGQNIEQLKSSLETEVNTSRT